MLSPQDDLIGHQLPTTFDQIDNSDPAWMERLWYTCHPVPGGDIILDIGLGYHPNRNVMDGFVGVAIPGKQWNFRVSRHLRPDPLRTTIGPLSIQVLEGLRHHRLKLDDNESGIRLEIDFHATLNPHEEAAHLRRRNGRLTENMYRMMQLGRYSGWLEFDGKRVTVDGWVGQRDHSWGLRSEMRSDETAPPLTYYPPYIYFWFTAQFANYGLSIFLNERAPGDVIYLTGERLRPLGERASKGDLMVGVEHDVDWKDDPLGQSMSAARFDVTFADGSKRSISVRTLPAKYYLKGGLYGGLNGWFQGGDKGRFYSEHDVWDLTDAATRRTARTLADEVVEVRDGDEVGFGIIEYGVAKGYPRYEQVQVHPPV